MKSDAVKMAESNERVAMVNAVRDVFTNPVVTVVGSIILIEYLQSHVEYTTRLEDGGMTTRVVGTRKAGGGWMGENVGTALETTLGAYLLLPSIANTAKQIAPLIETLGPLVAKAAV
jgi:hypothetical protein